MIQLTRMLSSYIIKDYKPINKVINLINNFEHSNKTLNILHNQYCEDTDNIKFIISDNELKKIYHGKITIFDDINDKKNHIIETNRDDDLFEYEMSIKNALKN